MLFDKMKLGTKLALMFGLLTFLIIAIGLVSSYSLAKIGGEWVEYESVINKKEEVTANAIQHLGSAVQNFKNYLLRTQDYDKKFHAELDSIQKGADEYRKIGSISNAEESLLKNLVDSVQAYQGSMSKVVEMKTAGAPITEIDGAIKGMDRPIETALNGLKKISAEATLSKGVIINAEIGRAKTIAAVLTAGGIVIALLMGILFTRNLLRQLGGEPAYAAEVAMKISSGDLAGTVSVSGTDSGSVLFVMKEMQDSLIRVVGDVRSSAMNVANGSSEIADGNSDLSARTESQAGSVEETASAIEEVTATAEKSADHAAHANKLTQAAAKVAEKGGHVVGDVVNTMKGINDSSHKIADIISVIDGIAFQTNILALNAAVEAARAGEQGRGFAVVASEVRNLAQRSALAAKEIKELITDSVSRVAEGTRLVDEAGSTMDALLSEIRHVTDIVAEISDSSREQNAGMRQINQAVILMDQTTQQNAAMVEQMAAAAESLQEQAKHLLDTVAVFKLPFDASQQQAQAVIRASRQTAASTVAKARTGPTKQTAAKPVGTAKKLTVAATNPDKDWEEF
ncbi:MAG: methyl-accepting chemotaxis protein [Pseudomonadota bacterium]